MCWIVAVIGINLKLVTCYVDLHFVIVLTLGVVCLFVFCLQLYIFLSVSRACSVMLFGPTGHQCCVTFCMLLGVAHASYCTSSPVLVDGRGVGQNCVRYGMVLCSACVCSVELCVV